MNSNLNFWLMIIFMVVLSYFITSNVMLTYNYGVYNHINKVYMALLMGVLMAIISYAISQNYLKLFISILLMFILIILIRQQIFINDNEFMKGMIEHHSMALLMAEKIREKTQNNKLKSLANNIITSQQKEINLMKQWLTE